MVFIYEILIFFLQGSLKNLKFFLKKKNSNFLNS